jgi:hypothetical protein
MKTDLSPTEAQYKVLEAWHSDSRALIAAGKVQRWEVVKWAVTANVALAAVGANANFAHARGQLFGFAVLMTLIGAALGGHTNYPTPPRPGTHGPI